MICFVSTGRAMIWQAFYCISFFHDIHQRDARDLTDTAPQLSVTGGDDVAFVSSHPLYQAIIGICSGMGAL